MERDQAVKFMHDLLRAMVAKKSSDLFITSGYPPAIKLDGKMTPVANQPLTPQHTAELARAMMNDKQAGEFEATKECNFAISPGGSLRSSNFGMVVVMVRGLIIMVGGTGS